jgi:hypothetical protein
MAEVFAPFIINRTIRNLTFYYMEGRNFVRKKSSLTRRKVLYSPRFERTRHYAALMGQASKIGSFLYNALPVHWRQSWMYRSFTGEAYTMLKKKKEEREIKQFLWDRYIQEVIGKHADAKPLLPAPTTAKRTYRKQDTTYWKNKTRKSIQRKARIQQRQRNAGLLAEASKIASELYWEIPVRNRNRSIYQQLTGWAMRLLKELEEDEETAAPLHDSTNQVIKRQGILHKFGYISCQKGRYYFMVPLLGADKRCQWRLKAINASAFIALWYTQPGTKHTKE